MNNEKYPYFFQPTDGAYHEDERIFSNIGGMFGPPHPGGPAGPGFPGSPTFPGASNFPNEPNPPNMTQTDGPPTTPPPSFTPQQPKMQTFAVDPGAIRGCRYRFTYIWLNDGTSFWFYPTYVGRRSIAGFRWMYFRWVYFGMDLHRINTFQCY